MVSWSTLLRTVWSQVLGILRMETPQPLWAELVPVFDHFLRKKKIVLIFKWYFQVFSFVLIASCSVTSKKCLAPFSLFMPSGIYTHGYDFRKSFLVRAEQFQIFQPLFMRWIVQAYNLLCAPSLNLLQCTPRSIFYWRAQHWTQHPDVFPQG